MAKRRHRGEGSVEEMPGGRWRGILSLGVDPETGKRRRVKVYGRSKAEALEKLREAQIQAGQGFLDASKTTVGEWLTQWLTIKKTKVEAGSWANCQRHVQSFLIPEIGSVSLAKLTAVQIEAALARLQAKGEPASKRRRILTTLKTALRDAVRFRLIQSSPAAEMERPKESPKEIRPFDRAQLASFLEEARKDRHYPLYLLAVDSGMRQGELFALDWPDLDLSAGTVSVTKSLSESQQGILKIKTVKTKKGKRVIPLSPVTVQALATLRAKAESRGHLDAPVFCDRDGGRLRKGNFRTRSFVAILKRSRLTGFRFHDLRHTCASLLLAAEVNIKVVSERLGHSNVTTTLSVYAHVMPGMQERAVKAMTEILESCPLIVPQDFAPK